MLFQYAAVSAKLKTMHAGFLTEEDYRQLMTKRNVGEVCSYLKNNTSYRRVLSDINEGDIHRTDLELLIEKQYRDEYTRMYDFMNLEQRRLLKFLFYQEENEFVKQHLRRILTHERESGMPLEQEVPPFFQHHTQIDLEKIAQANDLQSVVEACKRTDFYEVLKRAVSIDTDVFATAMRLDGFFYTRLWQAKNRYTEQKNISYFSEYIGKSIDMLNILWIYRSKRYYNMPNEIIYTYLIPVRYRLSEEDISRMVEAQSAQDVADMVLKTRYRGLFEHLSEGFFSEEIYRRVLYEQSKKIYHTASESMAAVFAYFQMKENEIKNLTTIIEGIRYSFDADAIWEHIYY